MKITKQWWFWVLVVFGLLFVILCIRYKNCKKEKCIEGETSVAQTNCYPKCSLFGKNTKQ